MTDNFEILKGLADHLISGNNYVRDKANYLSCIIDSIRGTETELNKLRFLDEKYRKSRTTHINDLALQLRRLEVKYAFIKSDFDHIPIERRRHVLPQSQVNLSL